MSDLPFAKHHAFIVGIDEYERLSPLKTAVSDARRLAEVLTEQQHFDVHPPLFNATGETFRELLRSMGRLVGPDDRVLFYFAGHGIAADGDDGPSGYVVPTDADRTNLGTFIPMAEIQEALLALPCRHLLLILDCCFSGAFKWSARTRAIGSLIPKRIYRERFDRFVADPAWQVITSAAYDQKALDVLQGKPTGDRGLVKDGKDAAHSPFATALFEALSGDADARTGREGDGVITATEVYTYVRDQVEPQSIEAGQSLRQTPGFFPLRKHDKGEFIFLHPRHRLNLPSIPNRSPYKGLASFDESDRLLFYGRDRVIADLQAHAASARLLVVSGASGTGKSSVVKAGLLPRLREDGHDILPVIRPGVHPVAELERVITMARAAQAKSVVLLIDQFEETITRCADEEEREAFMKRLHEVVDDEALIHRVILTVRSDFEPQLNRGVLRDAWNAGRCTVPPFTLEELKEVVVMPVIQEVLIFDPPELVEEIVGDVVQSPGALPLLSYGLSELYESYRASGRQDRALRKSDYDQLGGVMGALRSKADTLFRSLTETERETMKKLVLRMVSVEGDLASRRVALADLDYSPEENPRVAAVIERLVDARLVVKGEGFIEPAHDALVRAWKTLHEWIHEAGRDGLLLGERLSREAYDFAKTGNALLLWKDNPNLAIAARELKNPRHRYNARESTFIRKSVSRRRRRTGMLAALSIAALLAMAVLSLWALVERSTAEQSAESAQIEKERALLSLFEGLSLHLKGGQPGSVCVYGLCDSAPEGDFQSEWLSIGKLPDNMPQSFGETPEARDFAALRAYGAGAVVVYAHDGTTADREVIPESDNLLFAQNALAWLTPLAPGPGCPAQDVTILLWEGTYVKAQDLGLVRRFIDRRGWKFKVTSAETLGADLRCAAVLWYLSDWDPPENLQSVHVPMIEAFVRGGGGLFVGGLGWSYAQQGGPKGGPAEIEYAANLLGEPFGFRFTGDAFAADGEKPIKLRRSARSGQAKGAANHER